MKVHHMICVMSLCHYRPESLRCACALHSQGEPPDNLTCTLRIVCFSSAWEDLRGLYTIESIQAIYSGVSIRPVIPMKTSMSHKVFIQSWQLYYRSPSRWLLALFSTHTLNTQCSLLDSTIRWGNWLARPSVTINVKAFYLSLCHANILSCSLGCDKRPDLLQLLQDFFGGKD